MTKKEVIRCVNDGANFYMRFFANATHMEYHKNDYYSFMRPKQGEQGIQFVFDVNLENLSEKEQIEKIKEIKSLNMYIWWDIQSSDSLYKLIYAKDREKTSVVVEDDELYMAIFPDDQIRLVPIPENMTIKKLNNHIEFEKWASTVNNIMFGGCEFVHPVNHYHLCEEGYINCFACYHNDIIVAIASVMNNKNVCSLEFVATDPNYRRQGLAKAVCSKAIKDTFNNDAKIITLRASNPGTRELYTSLGFKIYNYAL